MNRQRLAHAKLRLKGGDETLKPAYERLMSEAQAALRDGPFSVTQKTRLPPSNDPHDYMSFGPYWWPDPAKPDGLPYIRRDGEVNPESVSTGSDSPQLGRMASAVETLTLAYYFSGKTAFAERALVLLDAWFLDRTTYMNPHLEYGQGIPGRVHGRDIGIIGTLRLVPVVDCIELLGAAHAMPKEKLSRLRGWFEAYLDWLRTSEHGKGEARKANNHGTWYDVQVCRFALFLGEVDAARAVTLAAKESRIAQHIEADGRQPLELERTRSFDYSVMNLRGLFRLAEMGEVVGVDLWNFQTADGRSLRVALEFLAKYLDDGTPWPYTQIHAMNRTALLPLLLQGAKVYRTHYELPEAADHRAWLVWSC